MAVLTPGIADKISKSSEYERYDSISARWSVPIHAEEDEHEWMADHGENFNAVHYYVVFFSSHGSWCLFLSLLSLSLPLSLIVWVCLSEKTCGVLGHRFLYWSRNISQQDSSYDLSSLVRNEIFSPPGLIFITSLPPSLAFYTLSLPLSLSSSTLLSVRWPTAW